MQVVAKLNNLRISARKTRLVADLIRGRKLDEARNVLRFLTKRGAKPFLKLLESAAANARNNFQLEEKNLYLAKILVDDGPKLKRWRPRSRGRAFPIQKKTSHLTIILETKEKTISKEPKTVVKSIPTTKEPALEVKAETREEKPRKPKFEKQEAKPKQTLGVKRFFRRKAF